MAEHTTKLCSLENMDIHRLCIQLARVISSGIPVAEGLALLAEDAPTSQEQELLHRLGTELELCGSLAGAMEQAAVFPPYVVNMVNLGETTGKLDDVLAALGRHYRREAELIQTVRSSLAYPMAMAGMMVAVIIVLLTRVMPIFQKVFLQLGTEMSGFAAILMQIGQMLSSYSVAFMAVLAILALGICFLLFTSFGSRLRRTLAVKTSLGKTAVSLTSACRFAGALAIAFSGGIVPEQAMVLASKLNEDAAFAKKICRCSSNVENGMSLSQATRESGIFSGAEAWQLSVAERTGTLPETMEELSRQLQEKLDQRLERRVAILEPVLVILLSLIVGVILLSVMLPLMGIMSSI